MNKLVYGLVALLVVVGAAAGYFAGKEAGLSSGIEAGGEISYSSALNRIQLHNALVSLANDLSTLRVPAGGLLASSDTTWNPPAVASTSAVATTSVTVGGAAVGDFCFVSFASTTLDSQDLSCYVSSASTTIVTLFQPSNFLASYNIGTSTLRVVVWPEANFVAPAALQTTTSTTP